MPHALAMGHNLGARLPSVQHSTLALLAGDRRLAGAIDTSIIADTFPPNPVSILLPT